MSGVLSKETVGVTSSPLSSCKSASFKDHVVDESLLLETPIELCCPITQDIFRDPVITTAGQVYERAAIVKALQHSSRDPNTGVDIAPAQLTPVYLLRKSAQEYRDATIRACIDRACSTDCSDPVKFLRRAAELSAETTPNVPGLTKECIAYLQSHHSNAYDVYALQIFARGLQSGGHHDLASNVFHKLLQMGEDKAQQAEILKQCLRCWILEYSSSGQELAVLKLTEFIQSHQTLSWTQIIDIMCEADISHDLVLKTCEALLQQSSVDDEGRQFKELLLKYTQLSLAQAGSKLHEHEDRLTLLESSSTDIKNGDQVSQPDEVESGKRPLTRRMLMSSAALLLLNVLDSKMLFWRLLRTVPLMVMLHDRSL